MRKLATIQRIKNIRDIQNADKIQVANVLGWQVVVEKGLYKENELVVFFEIDSILPEKPEFEFLRPRGFRVKTIKLRGIISQGLVMPLNILNVPLTLGEALDLTEQLNVVKYEPPAVVSGEAIGEFPTHLCPKTDELRVQVIPDVLERYKGLECYISEKIDGSSANYIYKDGTLHICSRNLELADTSNNGFWKWAKENELESKLKSYGRNIALQGELFGKGIQANTLKLKHSEVRFFNAFFIDEYRYANYAEFMKIIADLGLKTVPILSDSYRLNATIDELVEMAKGNSVISPNCKREGIVIRPKEEKLDLAMSRNFGSGRLSFKVVNPEYLLENE